MILSEQETLHFIRDGYLVVRSAFDPEHPTIAKWIREVWKRCDLREDEPLSWPEKIHLPGDDSLPFREVAPAAYETVMHILGGRERVEGELVLHNGFVCNFAMGRDAPWMEPPGFGGWHADGDFFRHFLDSREQSCLIGSYFTDIAHQGGATLISPGSHLHVARFLAEHPEGVTPDFVANYNLLSNCDRFLEMTARAGDVVIMHPLMLHASSQNKSNTVRLMNNNNVLLKHNFSFNRTDGDYSLIERATLHALGVDHYDFQITHERERIIPERVRRQKALAESGSRKQDGDGP